MGAIIIRADHKSNKLLKELAVQPGAVVTNVKDEYTNIVYSQKSRNLAAMKKRVYIDTSVFGGNFDEEFSTDTIPFFDRVRNGEITIIFSDILEAELLGAPDFVRQLLDRVFQMSS
jgi:hypothetical protein